MEAFVDPYASDPWCLCPKASQRLNALERAIYSTVAYRDVFDFAPSIEEIHRYLHTIRCDQDDVLETIRNGPLLAQHLATDGIYYALKARTGLFAVRLKRQALVERLWPLALRYGRYFANLPHVKMVGITGSFAAKNVCEDCDIDFMLLTDAGAMWRTRALAMTSALFNRKFGNKKFCPNVFLSVAALTLERKSLYDAQELTQMIPLYGRDVYADLRRANPWTDRYLPNAQGAADEDHFVGPPLPGLKNLAEWGSNSVIGRMLENFEANRKNHRFNETDRLKGAWTKSTRETHSLRDYIRQDIENAWRRRLEALEAAEAQN